MVMLTLWVAYTLYRWGETPSWKWAILTGLLAGLAAYVKLPAVFPIVLMLVGVVLTTLGFKKAINSPQVWVMAGFVDHFPSHLLLVCHSRLAPVRMVKFYPWRC